MAIYSQSQTTVVGLDELIKAFERLPDEALGYVRDGATKAAKIVCDRAKALVPINTGDTKRLLYVKKPTNGKKVKYKVLATIAAKKGAAPLAPLELGHKLVYFGRPTNVMIEPRPFLRPAADRSKDDVVSEIAASMNEALEKMGGMR